MIAHSPDFLSPYGNNDKLETSQSDMIGVRLKQNFLKFGPYNFLLTFYLLLAQKF